MPDSLQFIPAPMHTGSVRHPVALRDVDEEWDRTRVKNLARVALPNMGGTCARLVDYLDILPNFTSFELVRAGRSLCRPATP